MAALLPSQSLPTTAAGDSSATTTAAASSAAADLTLPQKHSLYDDMILSAIEALKSFKGSSWFAISKYISDNYSDLPPTHATILTDRLRELQSKGVIRMLKHCYKLEDGSKKRGRPPKSISSMNPNSISYGEGKKKISPNVDDDDDDDDDDESGKRKQGRAAKGVDPNWISSMNPNSISSGEGKKRGRPLKILPDVDGDDDESGKRKRGRAAKGVDPAANGPVYIVSQVEQLSSGVLKGFPGAVAIVLPRSLLTEKAARSPILIMPKGIQSLIDASASGEKRHGRPRKRDLLSKQGDVNGKISNVVAKRPWKIRDLLQKSGEGVVLEGDQETATGSEVVKRSVGRPRKKLIA